MSNDLVAYSRAGDIFHYRWAARRCLKLIYPQFPLEKIVIEGSLEKKKAGEYVIDVTEYSGIIEDKETISYYQLKHTTVQNDKPFKLSDLKDTFIGFAERFLQHKIAKISSVEDIVFVVVTNRKIDDALRENISHIISNRTVNKRFLQTIKKYTKLSDEELKLFCQTLKFEDSEGDYNVQREDLRVELAQLIAGSIDNIKLNNLISLVQEKVLPDSNGLIVKEDILKRFGVSSIRRLYPAPAIWENTDKIINRKQYEDLIFRIYSTSTPVIVHASGGVGKSVFCQEFAKKRSNGSLCISYDCFGAGSYRNRSESRHRHRDALVQIINELAALGLCNPLIPLDTTLKEDIVRKFLLEIKDAVESLRKVDNNAQLFILIDAADNAEMAAKEFNQACFAHEILREKIPDRCKLVLLCRTERVSLLKPQTTVLQLELPPFTEEETTDNLRKWYPYASKDDGAEFHRLTAGNPRVQANALDANYISISELLSSLGPFGMSVDKQIENQLNEAISKIKDSLSEEYSNNIHSICQGLASLPPHIPIKVLSKVANVSVETVQSFVSDIGRALWILDTSVQFRDEPTETWFRNTFLANKKDYEEYITVLEPIAHEIGYVSEVLPQLYLQAELYDKLIQVALSDSFLPLNSPIEARNIRVQRLQFAFKAALKIKQTKDSIMLAMRAGEEVSGNLRQTELFRKNIDLLVLLQSKEKVQEIAFKRMLESAWQGSENVYSASLLSGIEEYRGEARGYLRASENWLNIFFNEKNNSKESHREKDVTHQDILELAYTHLNIFDAKTCVNFLAQFRPKEFVFEVIERLIRRLIDVDRFDDIKQIIFYSSRRPYFLIAATHELSKIGIILEESEIQSCLDLLCSSRCRIKNPRDSFNDNITPAIISFLEACLQRNLSSRKILRVLRHYIPIKASRMVYDSHFTRDREIFLQALALRMVLEGKSVVDIEEISPKEFEKRKEKHTINNDKKKLEEVVLGLIPWYLLRAQILSNQKIELLCLVNTINTNSKKARVDRYGHDTLPNEIAKICLSILLLCDKEETSVENLKEFYCTYLLANNSFNLNLKLDALRAFNRLESLSLFKYELEELTYKFIKDCKKEGPEEIAEKYLLLSRAVLINSIDDASVYFEEAVNIISKFGDEIGQRWNAIVALAKRKENTNKELAYRLIRCAELVGESIYREKYWDRSEAMQVCVKMSPGIGISALSRWRDKDIGRFEYQFQAVLEELVESKHINPMIGWSLTRFFNSHHRNDYLSICLTNELSQTNRQVLLDDAVHLLQIEGADKNQWAKIKNIAHQFKLDNPQLDIDFHEGIQEQEESEIYAKQDSSAINWHTLFEGLKIETEEGFNKLIERFNLKHQEDNWTWHKRNLLKEVIKYIDEKNIMRFINVILASDNMDLYDIRHVLSILPTEWTKKVSFQKRLPEIIFHLGEKFAFDLADEFSFDYCLRELNIKEKPSLTKNLKLGIFKGLENENGQTNASNLWGYVNLVADFVDINQIEELVDFSLDRFELHLDKDFGDGCWDSWLEVSDNINNNIAGFIWSALGAPRSSVRWNATHCIKTLAEFNCSAVIDELVEWLEYDNVGAFGCKQFPFYNLHARLYLFIAFARISLDHSKMLSKYKEIFLKYALSEPHILIQTYASKIALNMEKSINGTYNEETIKALLGVGKSNIPIQNEKYGYLTNSFWHESGKIETDIDYFFGWDFDRYWFEPLAEVFGVPGKQVEDLAADIIVNKWGYSDSWKYYDDPRAYLWNSTERETSHSHGGHPKTDNLSFYLSYHSMLCAAAKLLNKMAIIKTRDWYEDDWQEWLSRHLLTRDDDKWLSDSRDPVPTERPNWIDEEKNNNWIDDIKAEDFIDCLKFIENGDLWINVKGGWEERDHVRSESFTISSALVSRKTSDALLRALATCIDPFDFKLPDYGEDDMEIKLDDFELKGWINRHSVSKELDALDPYADNLEYPSYSIGSSIVEKLKLEVDTEGKQWYDRNSKCIVLICNSWSSYRENKDEYANQSGMKLKASLSFLKHMCHTLDRDLILEVWIKREFHDKYDEDKSEYRKPIHKIFILSADGEIRTTK